MKCTDVPLTQEQLINRMNAWLPAHSVVALSALALPFYLSMTCTICRPREAAYDHSHTYVGPVSTTQCLICIALNQGNPAQGATSPRMLHRRRRDFRRRLKAKIDSTCLMCLHGRAFHKRGRMNKSTGHQMSSLIACTPMWCLLAVWWLADFPNAWGWGRLVPYHEPP
jgi:hypothetical protein